MTRSLIFAPKSRSSQRRKIATVPNEGLDLEINAWPPTRYKAYSPGVSKFAQWAYKECRADMPCFKLLLHVYARVFTSRRRE